MHGAKSYIVPGGQGVGTRHLWQLVRGGGLPGKKDLQLVQRVLSAVKGGACERKVTSQLVKMIPTAANCTSFSIFNDLKLFPNVKC